MKRFYSSLLILFSFSIAASAQQVEWLQSHQMQYQLNPGLPQHYSVTGNGKVFGAHIDSTITIYGSQIFGFQSVDCRDQDGNLLWNFPLNGEAYISRIIADHDGNTYIAGAFMETVHLGANDSLENTGVGLNVNVFMMALDVNGQLKWKRNVTVGDSAVYNIPALAVDPQGNCWYVAEGFDYADIHKLDASGNDLVTGYLLTGTPTVSCISFDPQGNMFVVGSVTTGTFSIADLIQNVSPTYGMFIARINANGHASWARFAHDVTFQMPEVVATADGNAYWGGTLMDSITLGSFHLDHPQWVFDIFMTKIDSSGIFQWALSVPNTPSIEGDFQRGATNFMDADANGNVYMAGTVRGKVHWGNGVVSEADTTWDSNICVISFDANGTPRWGISGGCYGFNYAMSVSAAAVDVCYFSAAINAEATFDSITTNTNGLYAYMLGKIGSESSTGIENPVENQLQVYPNPVSNEIAFTVPAGMLNAQLEIYNTLGEIVATEQVKSNSIVRANVAALPVGVYLLRIVDGNSNVVVGKFVKQ